MALWGSGVLPKGQCQIEVIPAHDGRGVLPLKTPDDQADHRLHDDKCISQAVEPPGHTNRARPRIRAAPAIIGTALLLAFLTPTSGFAQDEHIKRVLVV